jgi:hypothetical protein
LNGLQQVLEEEANVEVTTKIHAIENEKTELRKAIAAKKAILTRAKNAANKYRKIWGTLVPPLDSTSKKLFCSRAALNPLCIMGES